MIDRDAQLRRCGEPLTAELDGETVMLDPDNGAYYTLGTVGSRVWELLERPVSPDELCARLLEEFAVDEDICRREADAFVEQLLDAGLAELTT